jgi:hypothetical protein
MKYEYENFEDWFHELEGFSFRSERFFSSFPGNKTNDHKTQEYLKLWLRAAFDSARLEENGSDPS